MPTLDVAGIRSGQKAVVKTVFEGDRIEEFEAEIVGVLHGGRVDGDMILARATSERVVRTGVAAGMSGSPVYVDGKLIGALSSGWSFSREPLFGVTPIRDMLDVLDLPAQAPTGGTAGPTGAEVQTQSAGVRFGEFRWDDPPRDIGNDVVSEWGIERVVVVRDRVGGVELIAVLAVDDLVGPRGEAGGIGEGKLVHEPFPPQRLSDCGVPPHFGVVVAGQVDDVAPGACRQASQSCKKRLILGT